MTCPLEIKAPLSTSHLDDMRFTKFAYDQDYLDELEEVVERISMGLNEIEDFNLSPDEFEYVRQALLHCT